MKKIAFTIFFGIAATMWAAVTYNQNIKAIFGTGGNPDTGWTADSGANGITVALRAKNRTSGDTTNSSGVYFFAGLAPTSRGLWNYEFSINSGSVPLSTYDYYLSADGNPTQCIMYTTVNPLMLWGDNSYGTNATLNSQGAEGTAGSPDFLADSNNVAQNSQNITFDDYPGGGQSLIPNATYSYELYAVEKGDGPAGVRLASTSITVVVGGGGAVCAVPTNKNQCKDGGWTSLTRLDGSTFKNQGDCIQYVNTGR